MISPYLFLSTEQMIVSPGTSLKPAVFNKKLKSYALRKIFLPSSASVMLL